MDHIEIVAIVALFDNNLAGLNATLEHRVQDVLHLLLVQGAEQEDVTDGVGQLLALVVRFREDHFGPIVLVLLRVVRFRKDGLTTAGESSYWWLCNRTIIVRDQRGNNAKETIANE